MVILNKLVVVVVVLHRVWFRVKCLKQGIKNRNLSKQGRKISDFCLKQGQGMRGRAAPPHPRIYRVPPPPGGRNKRLHPVSYGNENAAKTDKCFPPYTDKIYTSKKSLPKHVNVCRGPEGFMLAIVLRDSMDADLIIEKDIHQDY